MKIEFHRGNQRQASFHNFDKGSHSFLSLIVIRLRVRPTTSSMPRLQLPNKKLFVRKVQIMGFVIKSSNGTKLANRDRIAIIVIQKV